MERDLKCMYCAESGITNTDVFIEIVDVELGQGWICKECFIESEKEKDEHLKELEEQLKQAEQTVEECHKYQAELEDKLQAKEQECEELKKDKFFLEREVMQFDKDVKDLNYFAIKLKQTLTEIKEIAEHCIKQDICTTCDNSDKCHIEDEEIPTYDVCKLILQKISEVE